MDLPFSHEVNGRCFRLTPIEANGRYGCEITEVVQPEPGDVVNAGVFLHARASVAEEFMSIPDAMQAAVDKIERAYS